MAKAKSLTYRKLARRVRKELDANPFNMSGEEMCVLMEDAWTKAVEDVFYNPPAGSGGLYDLVNGEA